MLVAYVHCVIVIYFPEVYPTNIRLVGVGFVNLMGRVGNIYIYLKTSRCLHYEFFLL